MKTSLIMYLVALAALVFISTHLFWLAELPERVATHFDGSGKANGWMSRRSHGIFMLIMGLGVPGFVLLMCGTMRFLPSSLMNVPRRDYWHQPEHYPEACSIMFRWSQGQAFVMLIWMTLLNHEIVQANLKSPPHLSTFNTWTLVAALLISSALSISWLCWRFLKAPSHSAHPSTAAES